MRRNAALVLSTATRSEPRAFLAGDLEQRQIDNFRGGLAGLLRAEFCPPGTAIITDLYSSCNPTAGEKGSAAIE